MSESPKLDISTAVSAAINNTAEAGSLAFMSDEDFERYRKRVGALVATIREAYNDGEKYLK